MTKKKEIEDEKPITVFCKMNSNNQITVPSEVRTRFKIDDSNLEEKVDKSILFEVKFIRVVKPTE